jgi:hypothetical protein
MEDPALMLHFKIVAGRNFPAALSFELPTGVDIRIERCA